MSLQAIMAIIRRMVAAALLLLGSAAVLVWGVGEWFSDTTVWSQWLSWIPALILVPAGILWCIGCLLLKNARRFMSIGVVLLILGPLLFFSRNWKAGVSEDPRTGITITQWTLGTLKVNEDAYADALLEINSDLNLIEGGKRLRWASAIQDWLGPDRRSYSTGIFSILSKLPVTQFRSVVWAQGIHMAILDVQGPGFETEPLHILLVDLPSDPNRSRAEIARSVQTLYEQVELPPIDLIIGDFNMTANSHSLSTLFPEFEMAWPEVGAGWAPTFPREWSVVRIDHVLTGPHVEITRLETIDPGLGRHRLQIMDIAPRQSRGASVAD